MKQDSSSPNWGNLLWRNNLYLGPDVHFDASKAAMYGHSLGGATAIAAVEKDMDILPAVADYEKQMHSYAWDRVEKSLERFNADDAIYKPGLRGDLAMMLMRSGLRMVNAIPPIKRRMAAAMTAERGQRD